MKQRTIRMIAIIILTLTTWQVTPAKTAQLTQSSVVASDVEAALQENETVRVIVNLNTPDISLMSMDDQMATAQVLQDSVLSGLSETEFTLKRRFQIVPALAGEINSAGLKILSQNSDVASIELDQPIEAHDTTSLSALQATTVHSGYGVTGQGVTVAVVDTGVDVNNADFSGRIVAQHCFTIDENCQDYKGDISYAVESGYAHDLNGHGTNVAGIIASNGAANAETKGFAPAAKLVAVRVLAQNGSGWTSDWVAGLEWVYANLSTRPVHAINMSLGTNYTYSGNCDSSFSAAVSIINYLHNAGVAVFASSGNAGKFTEISAPACLSHVIAVGATSDSYLGNNISWFSCTDSSTGLNIITCFTNRSEMLDILAPGALISSSQLNGGVSSYAGTSQASPTAAGVAALMLEVNPDLSPEQIEAAMQNTGVAIYDSNSYRTYYRINALKAVQSQTTTIIAGSTVGLVGNTYTFTAVVDPFSTSVPITYTWTVSGFSPIVSTTPSANSAAYTFTTTGTKTINLTVTNGGGSFTDTHIIKVFTSLPNKSYLPVEIK